MTLAKGEVFTKIAHAVLVFGLVFVVAELHHLRVAVENVGLIDMGSGDELDRIASSLDRLRGDLASRADSWAAVLDRSRQVGTGPAATERDSKIVTRPAVGRDSTRTTVDRVPLTVDWDARLESIVTTLEKLDASPRVRSASLPPPQASTQELQSGAVLNTIAAIPNAPKQKSGFLMMTPKQLLDRYGKPSSITFGEKDERGQARWWYKVTGNYLCFVLYDGRVMSVSSSG